MANHERMTNRTSDYMEVTLYNVDKDNVKPFESAWNELSRLSQMQMGYEWTKMYKAIAWEQSPYQYISVKMWGRKKYASDFQKAEDHAKAVEQINKHTSIKPVTDKYITVVDDSVVRLIH